MRVKIDEVRERAFSYGAATLSDAELVSIVAMPLDRARGLFEEVGGLNKLALSERDPYFVTQSLLPSHFLQTRTIARGSRAMPSAFARGNPGLRYVTPTA